MAKKTNKTKVYQDELAFYRNDNGKIQYNAKCKHCINSCRQSFRVEIECCPHYIDSRKSGEIKPVPV